MKVVIVDDSENNSPGQHCLYHIYIGVSSNFIIIIFLSPLSFWSRKVECITIIYTEYEGLIQILNAIARLMSVTIRSVNFSW